MGKYNISQVAYVKAVLHSVKYKTSSVNGLLIGRVVAATGDVDDNFTLEILNSVPLFHSNLSLLPTLEIALLQVEEYLAMEGEGLQIVGYYVANERYDDNELNSVARKIGDQIARYCPQAIVLLLDNKLMGSLQENVSKTPVMQLFLRDSARGWKQAGGGKLLLKEPAANSILLEYILEERQQLLVDFDDHIDDVSKDWLNRSLFD